MTKYRLKKDTPEFKAGTVFDMIENVDVGKVLTMNAPREDDYAFEVDSIDNFDEWFEEVPDEWLQTGTPYYRLCSDGSIIWSTWRGDQFNKNCQATGNVFKTEEAAQAYTDYLKATTTVRQDEGVLTPEQVVKDGYVYYICDNNEFGPLVYGSYVDCVSVNTILFDTKEHAQASRDKHLDEWKTIANYDWSRE